MLKNSIPLIYVGGEAISSSEYLAIGRVTEFKLSRDIGNVFRKWENQKLAYIENFGKPKRNLCKTR